MDLEPLMKAQVHGFAFSIFTKWVVLGLGLTCKHQWTSLLYFFLFLGRIQFGIVMGKLNLQAVGLQRSASINKQNMKVHSITKVGTNEDKDGDCLFTSITSYLHDQTSDVTYNSWLVRNIYFIHIFNLFICI